LRSFGKTATFILKY